MRSAANSDVKMAKAPPVESPIQAYAVRDLITQKLKVARNEVKNSSFAQRSAHRDSRIWRRRVAGMRTTSSGHHTWRPDLFFFFSRPQVVCLGKVRFSGTKLLE